MDVFTVADAGLVHETRIPTQGGARTGLFVPELDEIFVAAPAQSGAKASLRVFRADAKQ